MTRPDLEAPGSPSSAPFYWHFLDSTLPFTTPEVIPSQTRKRTSLCCCPKPESLASSWITQMEDLHTRNQIAMMKPWVIKYFPLRNGPTSQVTLKVEKPPWKTANRKSYGAASLQVSPINHMVQFIIEPLFQMRTERVGNKGNFQESTGLVRWESRWVDPILPPARLPSLLFPILELLQLFHCEW